MTSEIALTGAQKKELVDALVHAFPSHQSLDRMTVFQLELNLSSVVPSGSTLPDAAFALVRWAEAEGKVRTLITAAVTTNPGNPRLAAFASSVGIGAAPSTTPAVPPAAVVYAPTSDPSAIARELRAVLAGLYSTPQDAMRLASDAGVTRARVDFAGPMQTVWFNLLEEATKSGRTVALIRAARGDYPQNPALERLERFSATQPQVPAVTWSGTTALGALQRLLPAQFEEVVFKLAVPTHYMPGASAPLTERAVVLVRILEQQGRIPELGVLLDRIGVRPLFG